LTIYKLALYHHSDLALYIDAPHMKHLFRIAIVFTIVLALTYCWFNPSIREAFLNFDLGYLGLICFFYFLFYGLNALALFILARKSSKEVEFLRIVGISQFSSLIGYTLPLRIANIGVRAVYLKRRFEIPIGETIGGGLILTLMSLVIGAITLLIFGANYLTTIVDGQFRLLVTILIPCICLIAATYLYRTSLNTYFLARFPKLESLKRGITQLKIIDISLLSIISLLTFFMTALINQALINGVGMEAPLTICLLLAAVSNLSFLVALAPANLGTKELFYVGVGAIYGLNSGGVIAFLIVDRLVQIAFLSLSSAIFYFTEGKPQGLAKSKI